MKKTFACLSPYPTNMTANVRYRIQQYESGWNKQHIFIDYIPFASVKLQKLIYQRGKTIHKLVELFHSYIDWLHRINKSYDGFIVQREAALIGPPIVEYLVSRNKPVVFDFDDAIFLRSISQVNGIWSQIARPSQKTKKILSYSTVAWAGNDYLASYAKNVVQNVLVIPTVVDCTVFKPLTQPEKKYCTIGWIGSHSTTMYLLKLVPILQKLAKKHYFQLLIVGANETISIDGLDCINRQWSYERELMDFQSLDIGLYPIDDDEWALGKCGLKAIQYGAVGIPCVASSVGVNKEIIEHNKTGFLAQTTDDWIQALDHLLQDAVLRSTMGAAARERISNYYSVERYQPILTKSLENVLERS